MDNTEKMLGQGTTFTSRGNAAASLTWPNNIFGAGNGSLQMGFPIGMSGDSSRGGHRNYQGGNRNYQGGNRNYQDRNNAGSGGYNGRNRGENGATKQ